MKTAIFLPIVATLFLSSTLFAADFTSVINCAEQLNDTSDNIHSLRGMDVNVSKGNESLGTKKIAILKNANSFLVYTTEQIYQCHLPAALPTSEAKHFKFQLNLKNGASESFELPIQQSKVNPSEVYYHGLTINRRNFVGCFFGLVAPENLKNCANALEENKAPAVPLSCEENLDDRAKKLIENVISKKIKTVKSNYDKVTKDGKSFSKFPLQTNHASSLAACAENEKFNKEASEILSKHFQQANETTDAERVKADSVN